MHYGWCITAPYAAAESERAMRTRYLRNCRMLGALSPRKRAKVKSRHNRAEWNLLCSPGVRAWEVTMRLSLAAAFAAFALVAAAPARADL